MRFIPMNKWLRLLPLLVLCGCSNIRLEKDFSSYPRAYAKASDEQLLLNLARLANHEPVYFLQLAQISSAYSYSTGLGYSGSYITQHSPFGMMGSLTANRSANPTFQFVPISGSNYVQAVFSPISTNMFFRLIDQGYPAKYVARTVLSSVIYNGITNKPEYWVNDPADPTYPKFIKFCQLLSDAEISHFLNVREVDSLKPIYSNTMNFTDINNAVQAGYSVQYISSNCYAVAQCQQGLKLVRYGSTISPTIFLDTNYTAQVYVPTTSLPPPGSTNTVSFTNNLSESEMSNRTNSIYTNVNTFATDFTNGHYILEMRTFESVMFYVAQEQRLFEKNQKLQEASQNQNLYGGKMYFKSDDYGPYAMVQTDQGDFNRINPILTIKYTKKIPHFEEEVHVDYETHRYYVGDQESRDQNRVVFTMISYLFAQTAINTQTLPLQQLIQIP